MVRKQVLGIARPNVPFGTGGGIGKNARPSKYKSFFIVELKHVAQNRVSFAELNSAWFAYPRGEIPELEKYAVKNHGVWLSTTLKVLMTEFNIFIRLRHQSFLFPPCSCLYFSQRPILLHSRFYSECHHKFWTWKLLLPCH